MPGLHDNAQAIAVQKKARYLRYTTSALRKQERQAKERMTLRAVLPTNSTPAERRAMRKMVVLYCNIENNLRAIGAQNPFLPLDFFKALYSADTALRLMAYRIVDLASNAHPLPFSMQLDGNQRLCTDKNSPLFDIARANGLGFPFPAEQNTVDDSFPQLVARTTGAVRDYYDYKKEFKLLAFCFLRKVRDDCCYHKGTAQSSQKCATGCLGDLLKGTGLRVLPTCA